VADNFPEAARKDVVDSETLLSMNRYDGAGYLAGYAVECTLKTLIWVETGSAWGHNLNDLSSRALQLAPVAYGRPRGWRETLRYEAEGTVSEAESRLRVSEARRLHDEVITPMKLDGLIA